MNKTVSSEEELYDRMLGHMIYDEDTGDAIGLSDEATQEEWALYKKITTPDENGEIPIMCI